MLRLNEMAWTWGLRVVVSLAVVLGLIWALARVRKRVGPTGSDVVTVMSKIPVTKKGSVLLVKAGGETLLLGATDTQISLLASVELPQDVVPCSAPSTFRHCNNRVPRSRNGRGHEGGTLGGSSVC